MQASDSGATIVAMGIPKEEKSKSAGSGGFRVYVSNVVCGVNEHHMRNTFGLLGTVTAVQMQNLDWSKGAGFAFVQYKWANEGQVRTIADHFLFRSFAAEPYRCLLKSFPTAGCGWDG